MMATIQKKKRSTQKKFGAVDGRARCKKVAFRIYYTHPAVAQATGHMTIIIAFSLLEAVLAMAARGPSEAEVRESRYINRQAQWMAGSVQMTIAATAAASITGWRESAGACIIRI
jgi:hypothetical protein